LQNPDGVGVDGAGNVYFVDSENNALYKWTLTNQTLTTLSSAFGSPNGVALDSAGNVYVSDWTEVTVKKWSLASQSVTKTLFFPLPGPTGVAVGGAGNVFVPFARRDL
jgi:serine/threonine-protein kinase